MTYPVESEAARLYNATQTPGEFYISVEQKARIEKEAREHQASSLRKNVVLIAAVFLCMAAGSASIFMFVTSKEEKTTEKAIAFGSASISFLVGLIGGSQI